MGDGADMAREHEEEMKWRALERTLNTTRYVQVFGLDILLAFGRPVTMPEGLDIRDYVPEILTCDSRDMDSIVRDNERRKHQMDLAKKMEDAEAMTSDMGDDGDRPAEYTGPMVDTEGRGTKLQRERIDGHPADVLREKAVRAVGTGFRNDELPPQEEGEEFKSDRQEMIEALSPGDFIWLVREPSNAYDPNAIALFKYEEGREISRLGYIDRRIAKGLAADMDNGWKPYGLVDVVKRSSRGKNEWYFSFFIFTWADGHEPSIP